MKLYVAAHLKDMNRKVVYRLMETEDVLSKADITRYTGISAPTVMKITSYMVEKGLLVEHGEGNGALGRKPMLLRFNPDAAYTIGVDYEGGYVVMGVVNLIGEVKHIIRHSTKLSCKEFFSADLPKDINSLIEQSKVEPEKILGVGVGIPGAIDAENNIIHFAPLIGINEKEDLSDIMEKLSLEVQRPVFLENDVNAAAVGEYVLRHANVQSDIVYITVGTGVGAGIILEGKLHKGIRFSAGEVGYMIFDREFNTSKTEGGWLERKVSSELPNSDWSFIDNWTEGAKNMDLDKIEEIIDHVASYIGLCIANISSVLDIGLFVVGGPLTEKLTGKFFDTLNRYTNKYCLNEVKIERQLSNEPTVVGMASIVRENTLDILLS